MDKEKVMEKCIENAENLLQVARLAFKEKKYSIVYHLAALALEEIGKIEIYVMYELSVKDETNHNRFKKWMDDHEKKLFWAFFSETFGKQVITKEQIDEHLSLSKYIHENRLDSLYVNPLSSSQKSISRKNADLIINLADSKIQIQKKRKFKSKLTKDERILKSWFMEAVDDERKKLFIFGRKSMERLADSKDVTHWIGWLKSLFDEQDKVGLELAKAAAQATPSKKGGKKKWQIVVEIKSDSHHIRNSIINEWNKKFIDPKLRKDALSKKAVVVEFTALDNIPIQALWNYGLTVSRAFLIALNVVSRGLFWWTFPEYTGKYYKKIMDLQEKAEVEIKRDPELKISWGNSWTITEEMLLPIMLNYLYQMRLDRAKRKPYEMYLRGLTILCKIDVNFEVEETAYMDFYNALKTGCEIFEDWDGKTVFKKIIPKILKKYLKTEDDLLERVTLAEEIESKGKASRKITLTDVIAMKLYCDLYLGDKANTDMQKQFEKDQKLKKKSEKKKK
jgi:AbiV family abortive infection protein